MKKNKVIALSAAAILSATAVIGGTMAYFTDADSQKNVFVLGNVKIDLDEATKDGEHVDNGYHKWLEEQKLIPTTESQKENTIDKVVTIKNTGDSDAYVWAEIWIPTALDHATNPSLNSLHFNYSSPAVEIPHPVGIKTVVDEDGNETEYRGYIHYDNSVHADGLKAGVLAAKDGEDVDVTKQLLHQVYMDSKVTQCTNEDHEEGCLVLADKETHYEGSWDIIVNAVGIQADTFENIQEAMEAYYAENPVEGAITE